MKTFKYISLLAVLTMLNVACKDNPEPEIKTIDTTVGRESAQLDPNATYVKAEFGIDGMTCAMGCAKTIEKKLAKVDGVKSAKVDFVKQLAMVEYDEAKVTHASLSETVKNVGDAYSVHDMKTVESFSKEK